MHDVRHHSRSARRGTRRRSGLSAALIVALALPAVAAAQGIAKDVLVMPFDNPHQDPKLYWLAEGSAIMLAEYLGRYGAATVPREDRRDAFDRLQLPPAAALSHATVIKVGQFVGAAEVIIGSYELAGDHLTVRARVIQLDAGRMTAEVVERGALSQLFDIYDRTARRIQGVTAAAPAPLAGTLLTSIPALEAYAKGLVAESPVSQQAFLEQAAKAAPAEDRIKLALWNVHTDVGRHLEALAIALAVPATSLHARAARYLAALSQMELKRYEDAFNTLKALQSDARSAEVLNAMGVVQVRRGATTQTGRAVYYFSQASQVDPTDADYFFNLGYGYWLDKDPAAAIYWLREAVRRDPTDRDAHLVLAAALQQSGAQAEAARERELAQRLTVGAARIGSDTMLRGLERLKTSLDRSARRVDSLLASSGQRDQTELARHHLEAGRRAIQRELDRQAEQELRRALYLSPYLAEAHLLLGRIYLRAGRSGDAIQAFRIALWSEESAAGHVALAEAYLAANDPSAAKEEISRALAIDPNSSEAQALRAKIGQ
jgi:Tfp pilus assembly protein PilF/TolB-like protein